MSETMPDVTSGKQKAKLRANAVELIMNALTANLNPLARQTLLNGGDPLNDTHKIDRDCGYKRNLVVADYQEMYDREGIATRLVEIMPEECWKVTPTVYETEDVEEVTEFEKAMEDLLREIDIWHFLHRADILAGVGQYGVILLGVDDGAATLAEPIQPKEGLKLIFMQPLGQQQAVIEKINRDKNSEYYGQPEIYKCKLSGDPLQATNDPQTVEDLSDVKVHRSRILHLAEELGASNVYGRPIQQTVWNRLIDLRKILGGSAEGLWRAGFPYLNFNATGDVDMTPQEKAELKEELVLLTEGLQRALATRNLEAKTLAMSVQSPADAFMVQLKAISIARRIPLRKLMGSEEGKLAAEQDSESWVERVMGRRERYLTPVIRRFVKWLIEYGILPAPAEENDFTIAWPDPRMPSKKEVAETARDIAAALKAYIDSGASTLMPPEFFFTLVLNLSIEETREILEKAEEEIAKQEEKEEEERARLEEERLRLEAEGMNNPQDDQLNDGEDGDEESA